MRHRSRLGFFIFVVERGVGSQALRVRDRAWLFLRASVSLTRRPGASFPLVPPSRRPAVFSEVLVIAIAMFGSFLFGAFSGFLYGYGGKFECLEGEIEALQEQNNALKMQISTPYFETRRQ